MVVYNIRMIDKYKLKNLKEKLDRSDVCHSTGDKYKLIYDWVKTGHISLGEFRALIKEIS